MNNHIVIKLLIASILFLFISNAHAQKDISTYYIYMSDNSGKGTEFKTENDKANYIGKNQELKTFFSAYEIKDFYQAFAEIPDAEIQKVFVLKTKDTALPNKMLEKFPSYYKRAEDISIGATPLNEFYPSDYGTTSPVPNLGANVSRKDLDYINAPKAWGITTGNPNIIIGISDEAVDNTLDDLTKTDFIQGFNPSFGLPHGTNVAALAAADGDNEHGSVGVCYDCDILASDIGFGTASSDYTLSNLYKLANEGAHVINMSWTNSGYTTSGDGFRLVEQQIINFCVENFGTIFVAAAGNRNSFSTPDLHHTYDDSDVPLTPFGILYVYPASYDNVISVGTVNAKYPELNSDSYCCGPNSLYDAIYLNIEDSVSPNVDGTDINNPIAISGSNGWRLVTMNTVNPKVDILAPSYNQFEYYDYENGIPDYYGGGTSYAAPMISGTIGLMLSLNPCLSSSEVEDIIQLTSKDVEHLPMNIEFFGLIGAGKLETGNAVEFVDEMQKNNGLTTIKNHRFYRYDFNLEKFNNNLLIENVQFEESTTVNFTAKNAIELGEGTNLEPNASGYTSLNIDNSLNDTCAPLTSRTANISKDTKTSQDILDNNIVLHPNPTKDKINIEFLKQPEDIVSVELYNIQGVLITKYNQLKQNEINISNLKTGIYLIKIITKNNISYTKKIIKI